MNSMMFTIAGDVEKFEGPVGHPPVFRKMLDIKHILLDKCEHAIVSYLKDKPHPNIVKIHEVTDTYYDAELLDVNVDVTDPNMEKHMRAAKNHLRSYGVTYMDWKCTNVGVDITGTYKLFDFNLSGYKENGNWIVHPYPGGYAYKRALRNGFQDIPDMDDYSFSRAF